MLPSVEQAMIDFGIKVVTYWLDVGQDEQTRRLEARIDDGRKTWTLTSMDLESDRRWYDCSRARDDMFAATDTELAPWLVADSSDEERARRNIIRHLLDQVPTEPTVPGRIALPARQERGGYTEPDRPQRRVPDRF